MKSVIYLSAVISAFFFLSTAQASLSEALADAAFQAKLDQVSSSQKSKNHLELLHLGKKAFKKRLEAIASANHYVYQSVPFWMGDDASEQTLAAFERLKLSNPNIDLRFLVDWASPVLSDDVFVAKHFAQLHKLAGRNQVWYWNEPAWRQPWSYNFFRDHLHQKMLIIDGWKGFFGGLNVGDGYDFGGSDPRGFNDTDLYVEGPLVADATEKFLRQTQFATHMIFSMPFPSADMEKYELTQAWFRPQEASFSTLKLATDYGLQAPFDQKMALAMQSIPSFDFRSPDLEEARLVFSLPLVDKDLKTGKEFSRFFETLKLLMDKTEKSVRLHLPYPAITQDMIHLLTATAKRGVSVEVIVNSRASNDVGDFGYFGGLGSYLPLIEGGVKLYEWQGHKDLKKLEKNFGCTIPYWPGGLLHGKVVMLDDEIAIVGSHNMNVRSDYFNSETMVIAESKRINRELREIFDSDLDLNSDKSVTCKDGVRQRNRYVEPISLEKAKEWTKKYQKQIRATNGLLYRI